MLIKFDFSVENFAFYPNYRKFEAMIRKTTTPFQEVHNYRKIWITLPLIFFNGLLFLRVLDHFNDLRANQGLVNLFLLIMLLSSFFMALQISTKIDDAGVHVRFFPFQWSYRLHKWSDIEKCYIRSSRPITEFGGWGWRYSFNGFGKAYTLYGFTGLQIKFKNGKQLFIGTRAPDALKKSLEAYKETYLKP